MSNDELQKIAERLRIELVLRNEARDKALTQSRELIRQCSECIRAIHRQEWMTAERKLLEIDALARAMIQTVALFPDLRYAGYTQDALKEQVEAHLTHAIIRNLPLPTPEKLDVETAVYLNGMSESATELRRFILDIMRREENHSQEAERLLMWMDNIYDQLVTFDFPDALTGGLRRQTDILRGVLERTRGDLTTSLRQQQLQNALVRLEKKLSE